MGRIAVCLGILCGALVVPFAASHLLEKPPGAVRVDPAVIDLGTRQIDVTRPSTDFLVQNISDASTEVHLGSDCSCLQLDSTLFSLRPREAKRVQLTLNPTAGVRDELYLDVASEITVKSIAGQSVQERTIPVSARFYQPYMFDEESTVLRTDFGTPCHLRIDLTPATPELGPPEIAAFPSFVTEASIEWNSEFDAGTLVVLMTPSLKPGSYAGAVELDLASSHGDSRQRTRIPVKTTIAPPYRLSSQLLLVPANHQEASLQLIPTGPLQCEISLIDFESPAIEVSQHDTNRLSVRESTHGETAKPFSVPVDVKIRVSNEDSTFDLTERVLVIGG